MTDIQFAATPTEAPKAWSLFTWTPTSISAAQAAENKLLSKFLNFQPAHHDSPETSAPSTLIARVGLVEIKPGELINTLVIDRTDESGPDEQTMGPGVKKHEVLKGSGGSAGEPVAHLEQDVAPVEEVGQMGKKKKVLVMCHGYGAGLGFFYRNYAGLSEVPGYRIYSLDWLGMANSSRPPFPRIPSGASDAEIESTASSFFVDSLEAWRIKNNIDSFTLMGHSLGGYLSAAYALAHPSRVEKLVLVSPAGVGKQPEVDIRNRPGLLPKLFKTLWTMNVTPMTILRGAGPWGPGLVHKYTTRRFSYLDDAENADLRDYIYHISAQPGSGEFALARLLLPGAWARIPLYDRLAKLQMPTTFLYGASDWMDYRSAVAAAPAMRVPTTVARVADSGHHLYLDNPQAFNNAIIAELEGRRKGQRVDGVDYVYES
ncbi:hypothetical protein HDU86_006534 [Geranomyces michiganensis]|nr:hypothetical protein HDU86_006534 [Geranomyces michiganensis]